MKLAKQFTALVLTALAATTALAADVSYALAGSTEFTLQMTTAGFVAGNATFSPSSLQACSTPFGECTQVDFVEDAFSAGLTVVDLGLQGIGIASENQTNYFYFYRPAFTAAGTHLDYFGVDTLTVTVVPEGSTLSLLALGLFVVAGAARSRGPAKA